MRAAAATNSRTGLCVALLVVVCLACVSSVHAFYLPGVSPTEYTTNAEVPLYVNEMTSTKTQVPYDFYSLPFCKPDKIEETGENLGQVLGGGRMESSAFKLNLGKPVKCRVLCKVKLTKADMALFHERIQEEYHIHWTVDNLPAATRKQVYLEEGSDVSTVVYDQGFPLGVIGDPVVHPGTEEGKSYLHNHFTIRLLLNSDESDKPAEQTRIVGFEVYPASVAHTMPKDAAAAAAKKDGDAPTGEEAANADGGAADEAKAKDSETAQDEDKTEPDEAHKVAAVTAKEDPNEPETCSSIGTAPFQLVDPKSEGEVIFTYDIEWESSSTKWSQRWDPYLRSSDEDIHWFSIINSLMIVLFLTGMVAMILMRTLSADFVRYNQQMEDPEDEPEETGWKLVHTDVFRPPVNPMLLSALAGTGAQVYAMTVVTMFFALLGFLSPATRGALTTAVLLLFAIMGLLAGYVSARNYKMLKQDAWKTNFLLTALLYPALLTVVFLVLDFFLWHLGSTGAVPFGTILALFSLWLFISVPLVFVGSYIGYSKEQITQPVRTMQLARTIPELPWYMNSIVVILAGGVLPFGAVFIELYFIMSSIWNDQVYYLFGFLVVVFIILTITASEIAISLCYFQLCAEDYHWWWRSFLTPGASAIYVFLYSISYFVYNVQGVGITAGIVFFGYSLIICSLFFVLTGTVGYVSCLLFVRKIYASVKVD